MLSQRKGSVHLMFIVSLKHDSCERVKGTIAVPLTIPAGAWDAREAAVSLSCTFTGI